MKRSIKTVLIVLLILAVLALAGFVGYEVFKVKKVVVEGNEVTEDEEIISLSGIEYGTNIFVADLDAAREGIAASPFLECTEISRVLPDTVAIKVKERCRRAVVQYLDKYLMIDEEGNILETGSEQMKESYPVVTGINITSFQIGCRLQATDTYQVDVLKELLVELQKQNLTEICEVDVSDPVGIILCCSNGLKVYLGEAENVKNKLERMKIIMLELEKKGIATGTIDVSGANGGTYSP
ncbi:MAG: cell division protein FtsQ/DivIB [Christensenellales bacterium]